MYDSHHNWGYKKLKNELQLFYPLLSFIEKKDFQDRCQTVFPEIKLKISNNNNQFAQIIDNNKSNELSLQNNKSPDHY